MGLADLGEQKNVSIYQVVIYVALFLITGYMSYRYMVLPEFQKLKSANAELGKQKALLSEMEESTRQLNVIANNAQLLDAELVSIRNRVFDNENDVLTFMRSLPDTTGQTGNNLMSIVPMKTVVLNAAGKSSASSKTKTTEPVAQPTTLPCKLKPIEVTFDGGYRNIISFLNELERSGQYMTASSMTISGAKDSSAKVSVKTVLNLVQLEIAERKPQIDVVLQQSKTSQTTAVAGAESNPATTPIVQTPPTQKPAVQQVATPSTPVANTPIVATSTPAKPEKTEKPSVVKPAEKTEKVASVASPKPQKTTEKVVPAQTAKTETVTKPSTSDPKQVAQSSNGVSSKQINGTKTANYSVRVGKFDYHENAQKLLNILNSHGYSAWMKTYSHKGKRTYWVYVGTFESKDKAEAFASSMQKELSYIDDYVILGVKNGLRRNS